MRYRYTAAASAAVAIVVGLTSAARAAMLTVDTTEPTGTAVVASDPHSFFASGSPGPVGERDTFTTVFAAASGTIGLRGQTFTMPDNPNGTTFDLSTITIRADANPDGSGVAQDMVSGGPSMLKLWVFEWPGASANDGSQWTTGNGSTDGNAFDGTGVTNFLVNGASFDITRTFDGEFLHFSTPGVQLAENKAYGLLISLDSGPAAGFKLDQVRDGNAPTGQAYLNGANLRSDAASNSINANGDDLVFYVEATPTPAPEPAASGMIGVAGMAAMARRRKDRQR